MRRSRYTGIAQLVEHWSPKPGVGSSSLSSRAFKYLIMLTRFINYCKDSYNELVHKTTWPTMKQMQSQAVLVLSSSLIIALAVFGVDLAVEAVMNFIYSF